MNVSENVAQIKKQERKEMLFSCVTATVYPGLKDIQRSKIYIYILALLFDLSLIISKSIS